MSLPAEQQRVLDRIENVLQASEPRLASMYSIFTRLTNGEMRPRREELPAQGRLSRLWSALSPRRVVRAITPRGASRGTRAIVLAQMITTLAVLGVLVGLAASSVRGACSSRLGQHSTLIHTRGGTCRAQADFAGYPIPSK
jgi:hypothetical protein